MGLCQRRLVQGAMGAHGTHSSILITGTSVLVTGAMSLLSDGAIRSIAYNNIQYKDLPETWNMHMGSRDRAGHTRVAAEFVRFYLGERRFHLDRAYI